MFSGIFKLLRGDNDFTDEFKYGQKVMLKNFLEVLEDSVDSNLDAKQKKAEMDKKKKAVKKVMDIGE